MRRIWITTAEMMAAAVFLLPVFWIYGRKRILDRKMVVPYLMFACYLAAIFVLVGIPNITYIRFSPSVNLIPFVDMIPDWKNACLNVALFAPLGIFLPGFWEAYRSVKKTAFAGLVLSCFIEVLQIFTFRATDINDLITNTVGAVIGFYVVKFLTGNFQRFVSRGQPDRDLWVIGLTVFAVMVIGYPFSSMLLWEVLPLM